MGQIQDRRQVFLKQVWSKPLAWVSLVPARVARRQKKLKNPVFASRFCPAARSKRLILFRQGETEG